jgi:restriction endonuclease S subunit
MTNSDTSIPNGWKEITLKNAIKIIGGGTPRTNIAEYWNGNIPWLSVAILLVLLVKD